MKQPTWDEILAARWKREDEAIARKYAPYASLGRGHLQPDRCRVRPDW